MASIAFKKIKDKSTVAALMRHNDSGERLRHEHANEHIDKSRTRENIQLWDYKTSAARFNARIKNLDNTTNTNKRKDRVEAVAIEIPMPAEGMTREAEIKIAQTYCEFLCQEYGKDNICGFWYHRDEIHTYRDSITGETRTSRGHIHAIVVPEIDGRLCCKQFTGKKAMITANRKLDALVRQKHNIPFLTGETPKKARVEDLKAQARDEQLQERIDAQEREISETHDKIDYNNGLIAEQREELSKTVSYIERGNELIDAAYDYIDWINAAQSPENFTERLVDTGAESLAQRRIYVDQHIDNPREDIEQFLGDERDV